MIAPTNPSTSQLAIGYGFTNPSLATSNAQRGYHGCSSKGTQGSPLSRCSSDFGVVGGTPALTRVVGRPDSIPGAVAFLPA